MRVWRDIIRASSAVLLLMVVGVAWASPTTEYKVKAGFIYNFTKFVVWPNAKLEFNICILGKDHFNGLLKAIEQKSGSGRTYKILNNPANPSSCDILYTDEIENASIRQTITDLASKPVLIVTSNPEAAHLASIVTFVEKDKKIKLIVNKRLATQAGLSIDSQLLEVAIEVID